jgi:glucans biosynthesis protein C
MLFVVPPMIFFIWRGEGNYISVQEFSLNLLKFEWFPHGNFHWLHLWYLAFIFIFCIVVIPVMMILRTPKARVILNNVVLIVSNTSVLLPVILLFHLPYYISRNFLPSSDVTDLIYYFPYFIFGALFFAQPAIRVAIAQNRKVTLAGGLLTTSLLYFTLWIRDESLNATLGTTVMELIQGPLKEPMISLNQWFWVLTVGGFAIRYLDFGSKFLSYANRVVYPFYILHQTIIIALAYYLIPVDASIFTKFCIILTGTVLSIVAAYELVLKRFTITKLMFGIKTDVKLMDKFPRSVGFINRVIPQLNQVYGNPSDRR